MTGTISYFGQNLFLISSPVRFKLVCGVDVLGNLI